MAIKETPVSVRVYYKALIDATRKKHEEAISEYEKLLTDINALHEDIKSELDVYSSVYKINLMEYREFVENKYIDGRFNDFAKNLFINKKGNYTSNHTFYKLYKLSKFQKNANTLSKQINLYERILDLKLSEYSEILRTYYTEVHKQMIINGYGYDFENNLGWICINRCKVCKKGNGVLDFQATKRNKEKLIAEGKRLWNKDEAKYAASIGAEYKGVDYRVYRNDEYIYEIPLINCKIGNGEKNKFKTTFYRANTVGKTDEELLKECNYDKEKICNLHTDIREKLRLCLLVDDILYLNFIRNEGQQSAHTSKANRKNR